MLNEPTSKVRKQQRFVLAVVMSAKAPLSPAQIAEKLNGQRAATQLDILAPIDVEASLAALMLREDLAHPIRCKTRTARAEEITPARRSRLGAMSGLVILSACAAIPQPPTSALAHAARSAPSYFGNREPVEKAPFRESRPLFSGSMYRQGLDTLLAGEIDESALADKTVALAGAAGARSYFDDSPARVFMPRDEADMAPPELLASTVERDAHTPKLVGPSLVRVAPPHLAFLPEAPRASSPFDIAVLTSPPPVLTLALDLPSGGFKSPPRDEAMARVKAEPSPAAKAKDSTNPPHLPSTTGIRPGVHHPDKVGAFGGASAEDIYSDLVTFGNGSITLKPEGRRLVESLVSAAKEADAIQLRGRVGYRVLTPETAKQAVARAIAVRELLVANGVPREKVRIRMPRDADLLVPSNPGDARNMSVSVFMRVDPQKAMALGLEAGKTIASVSRSSASAM